MAGTLSLEVTPRETGPGSPGLPAPAESAHALATRLEGLDTARGIAAFMVMVSHLVLAVAVRSSLWSGNTPSDVRATLEQSMGALGAWGVGLFFVLSGVCIHLPVARALARGERQALELDLSKYFRRRFIRIYPPHFVALVLSILVAVLLPASYVSETLLSVPTFTQVALHVGMVHSLVPSAMFSVNSVLWTIAVEAQFYVAYPLLLWARRRVSFRSIAVVLLLASLAVRVGAKVVVPAEWRGVLEQGFVCRWWEWALGAWVAEQLTMRTPRWRPGLGASGAMLAVTYVLGLALPRLPLGGALRVTLWPMLFALCIFWTAHQAWSRDRLLDRLTARLGEMSYSLYLIHPIVLALVLLAVQHQAWSRDTGVIASLVACIVLSGAFFRGVEKPFLEMARRVRA